MAKPSKATRAARRAADPEVQARAAEAARRDQLTADRVQRARRLHDAEQQRKATEAARGRVHSAYDLNAMHKVAALHKGDQS